MILERDNWEKINEKYSWQKFKEKYKIAAVACIILISICFTVPTFAKNIPVINSIIQNLKDKEGIDGDYKKYSKQLENSATDNGITLKVKEIICDDNTLEVAYTLTSKDDIRDLVDMSRRKKMQCHCF